MLVDLKPTGEGYMEDFHAAGGMPALLWELRDLLHLRRHDVTGLTLGRSIPEPAFVDRRYIRARAEPVSPVGGLVALFGSLAPRGAILKRSAATPSLFETEARAWSSTAWRIWQIGSMIRRWTSPTRHPGAEECRPTHAGRDAGGRLFADPAETGTRRGEGHGADERLPDVRHRIWNYRSAYYTGSGRRWSARLGGERRSDTPVGAAAQFGSAGGCGDLERRRALWRPPARPARGWDRIVADQVLQADEGCDLRVLQSTG